MPFLSLVTLAFDLDIQTHLSGGPNTSSCEFGAHLFSGSRDISYTKQNSQRQCHDKQNLTQFTACDKNVKIESQKSRHIKR